MASPSYPKAPKIRLVPGTAVEFSKRRGDFDFLIAEDAWVPSLEQLGYHVDRGDNNGQWITARPAPELKTTYLHGSKPTVERVAPDPAESRVITVTDERHTRNYRNAALAAVIEEQIAKIQADYERDAKRHGCSPIIPNAVPSQIETKARTAKSPKPVKARRTPAVTVAASGDMPKRNTPEWKRLVRRLYREHTGKAATSITREVLATLHEMGVAA